MKDYVAEHCKAEDISRIIGESVQFFGRSKAETNEEVAARLNEFFDLCYRAGQIPTFEDMALSLGVTRQILNHWVTRDAPKNPERAKMVLQAKEILAAIDAKLVSEGKIPQVTYIFRAKNYFDLKDQQDVVISPNQDLMADAIDEERLRQKYLQNAVDATEVQKALQDPVPVIVNQAE